MTVMTDLLQSVPTLARGVNISVVYIQNIHEANYKKGGYFGVY